ncbi:ATP-binding protein [Amycolatopsis cihanbeyliensis]|uniref:Regulatory LuxR family protein n=1 Tax=Amycolatopsis cihanbeyliensis TaxID=1128664 RepID=A0A542DS84_AMYCI|nr:LuxR family transcriptional regulator [Amycolatopsis cihanbeyliensis]TQJ05928.1 regulatory LuxR family protein [Amycolatopsis cihanbeyliensis]
MFPLVGREESLSELSRALDDTQHGRGGCVVVEGVAGIGKSRLLDALVAQAHARDFVVVRAQACELDSLVPARALRGLFEAGGPLGKASALGLVSSVQDPGALVAEVRARLDGWAARRPVLVALDDAHWADEVTTLMLRVLVNAPPARPVIWLLTRRPVPAGGRAQASIDHLLTQGAGLHRLGPISPKATADMCTNLLAAEPDAEVVELAARCNGNPFLLEGLLTAAWIAGRVRVVEGTAVLAGAEGLPDGFVAVVDQYLLTLSAETRRMLSAASVLGRPFTVHEVAVLTGCDIPELLAMTTEAIHAAVLVGDGLELTFRHDLIREALYVGLPGPVRSALHREIAAVARRERRSPGEAAEHLIRSGHVAGEDGAEVLRLVVEQMGPAAPNTAADLIIRMLDLFGPGEAGRAPFVAEAVRLLATAGRGVEATALAEGRLRNGVEDIEQAQLLLAVSEALLGISASAQVVEYTTRALGKASTPDAVKTDLLALQARGLLGRQDFGSADRVALQAIERSSGGRSPAAECTGIAVRGLVARAAGELDRSLKLARESVRIADQAGDEALRRHTRLDLCQVLTTADQFEEAESVCASGQRDADRLGTAWPRPLYRLYRAELRMAAGLLDDAWKDADSALGTAERINSVGALVRLMALLARLSIHRADLDMAEDYLRRAAQVRGDDQDGDFVEVIWALTELSDAKGRPDLALDRLADAGPTGARWLGRSLLVHEPRAAAQVVRMASRTGRIADAEAAAECASELAERNPASTSLVGSAAHAMGLLHEDIDELARAVKVFWGGPRPLATASALEDLAVARHAAGHRSDVSRLVVQAEVLYDSSRSQRDTKRVRSRLSALGVRGKRREDADRARQGWASLTPSELRVIRLVAHGLTNREVAGELRLSPHTVDSHLRRCFAKLGVSSRVDLTRHVLAREAGHHGIA